MPGQLTMPYRLQFFALAIHFYRCAAVVVFSLFTCLPTHRLNNTAIWNLNTKQQVNSHQNGAVADACISKPRAHTFQLRVCVRRLLCCGYTRCRLFHNTYKITEDAYLLKMVHDVVVFSFARRKPCSFQFIFSIGENCNFCTPLVKGLYALISQHQRTPQTLSIEPIRRKHVQERHDYHTIHSSIIALYCVQ